MTVVWVLLALLVVYALFSWSSYEGDDFDPWPLTARPEAEDSETGGQQA